MRFGGVVAVVMAGLLAAAPAHADGAPFMDYLVANGFGYLDAQRVLSDGAVACRGPDPPRHNPGASEAFPGCQIAP